MCNIQTAWINGFFASLLDLITGKGLFVDMYVLMKCGMQFNLKSYIFEPNRTNFTDAENKSKS